MDPLELGKLLILLAGLAGLYLKLNQAMRSLAGKGDAREISNDPLKVQETMRPATIADVALVDRRITALEVRIERHMSESATQRDDLHMEIASLRDRIDDKFSTLNDKLGEIGRAVGRLEGS